MHTGGSDEQGGEGSHPRHEAPAEDGAEGSEVDGQAAEHGEAAMSKIEMILWAVAVVWGWDLIKAVWRDMREPS